MTGLRKEKMAGIAEEGENPEQPWRLHLRRGIVASRRQGRRSRQGGVLRLFLLLAAVMWVLFLVLTSR